MLSESENNDKKLSETLDDKRYRLNQFDAFNAGIVFTLWLGPYVLSPNRYTALQAIFQTSGRPVCFITDSTLDEWIHPDFPLHPAYQYLSEVHRSDYLRCYLMHLYGGGYTDIKPALQSWTPYFTQLAHSEDLALGYPEISASAVAQLPGELGEQLRIHYAELIGFCSMICKPKSIFTQEWFDTVHVTLDAHLNALRNNPAQHPMDRHGVILPDSSISKYPLRWTELGGNIFHPAVLKNHKKIIKSINIIPQLFNYR